MPTHKLIYFDLPGRGEVSRILFDIGGLPYEDKRVQKEEWAALKPTTPFGQIPVLEVDGKPLAQSAAIERYVAKLAGLTPDDPWEAAQVDMHVALQQEVMDMFAATYTIQDTDVKIKARQDIVAGPLKVKFEKLQELIKGPYLTGDKLTYADVLVFKNLSGLVGGAMDGVDTKLLDSYPKLKELHNRIAEVPAIKARYANAEGSLASYKPLP